MAYQLFQLPKTQPFGSGVYLPGAKLNFYLTGTSTPTPVYTTSALSVAHSQPVVADATGTFAEIYLDPTISYKVTLSNSSDVLQYTVDPVNDSLLTQSYLGLIFYPRTTAEISGGVTPTYYYIKPGDIRRYGGSTAASGATNDTAFNSSVAQAKNGGAPVLIEDGEYAVAGNALIDSYSGSPLLVRGSNASLVMPANTKGISVTNSDNVRIEGLAFKSAAASGLTQRGVYVNNSGRVHIQACYFEKLTYGVYLDPTKTGLTTGSYPIPNKVRACTIKACAAGVYCAPSAEYVLIESNTINDCTLYGVLTDAGNTSIKNNEITGNSIGITVDGSNSSNGDHGSIVGNTVNHNDKCGIYIHDLDYSMLITGNNIWAQIGTDFAAAPLDGAYGVYLSNVKCVQLSGNIIANNERNLGLNGVTYSSYVDNIFISDSGRTTYNIHQVTTVAIADGNIIGPNIFNSTLLGGADNNDPNKLQTPTFTNSWANLGSNFRDVAYWKDPSGVVHFMGTAARGSINTAMFTLPGGYRPGESLIFACISNGAIARLQVDADGTVTPKDGNNAYFALDTVHFKAEA